MALEKELPFPLLGTVGAVQYHIVHQALVVCGIHERSTTMKITKEAYATYGSADVAVVQVNPRVNVLSALARIKQETGELDTKIHIVRAATPAPISEYRR